MKKPSKITEYEKEYQKIINELIASGEQNFYERLQRDFRDVMRKHAAYGTKGSDDMATEYNIEDHNMIRRLRNESQAFPTEMQGTADTLLTVMEQLMETDNNLALMNDYLAKFEDHYDALKDDQTLTPEERDSYKRRYEQVIALRDQIMDEVTKYKDAKNYNTRMLGWLFGQGNEHIDDNGTLSQHYKNSWVNAMKEFDFSYKGQDPIQSVDTLREEVRNSVKPELSSVVFSIESSLPDLADAFIVPPRDLTVAEKGFAVQNFDLAFNDEFIPKDMKKALQKEGKDIFDLVYIDGKSMNTLYSEKYASAPYYEAVEKMKCEFMRDAMAGKQIDLLIPGDKMKIMPVQMQIRPNSGLNAKMEQYISQVSQRDRHRHYYDVEITETWEGLKKRSKLQEKEKVERMWESKPMYSYLAPVEQKEDVPYRLPKETARTKGRQFAIRENGGKFVATEKDTEEKRKEKKDLLKEGEFQFNMMSNQMGIHKKHEIYEQAGIQNVTELFYIDGKPAAEYVKSLYPNVNLDMKSNPDAERLIKTEITSAMMSGNHYVEAVKVGMDEKGVFQVGVVQVQPDVRSLDGQEGFFATKPSKRMASLFKNDKHKDDRQNTIRRQFSEKLAVAATKAMKEREAQKDPYAVANQRFSLSRTSMKDEYFDKQTLETLKAIPSSASAELPRGEFGGYRTYAQLLLMSRHPEIRFSDLMDPDMYKEEKLAAGREVAEAFSQLYQGPKNGDPEDNTYLEKAAQIMKCGMEVMANLDVRKELLHAMELPEDLSVEEVKKVMNDPNALPIINGFMRSMSKFSVNTFQALGRVQSGKDVSVTTLDTSKHKEYPPVYVELASIVSPDVVQKYAAANSVTRAMNAEEKWGQRVNDMVRGTLDQDFAQEAVSYRLVADHIRSQIAEYGKASEVPNARDLLELASSGGCIPYITEQVKKARESGEKGLTISQLKNGTVDPALTTRLIENSKFSYALANDPEKAWKEVTSKIEPVLHAEEYFRNNNDDFHKNLGESCNLKTLHRGASRSSMARIYMLGAMGASFGDTINLENKDARMAAGDGLVEFMQNHQFHDGMSQEERKETARIYGELYHNAAERLVQEQLPSIDWKDPNAIRSNYGKLSGFSTIAIDYSQTKEKVAKMDGFQDAYGGKENYTDLDARIDCYGSYIKSVMDAHGIGIPGVEVGLNQRVSGTYMIEKCSSIFNGRTLNDLTAEEVKSVERAIRECTALDVWGMSCNSPEDMKNMEKYVKGEGPLPESALQAIRDTQQYMDHEEQIKDQMEKTQFMQDLEQDRAKTWEDVARKTDPVFYGQGYFRNNNNDFYHQLGTDCGLKTMGRGVSRTSVAKIYMMGAMGATMSDTINPRNTEKRLQAGDELTAFMSEHQLHANMTPEEKNEVGRLYGDIYHKAAVKIAEENLPDIDFKDPYAVKKNYAKLINIKSLAIDYSQSKENIEKTDGFVDAYGGKEHLETLDAKINYYGHFIDRVVSAHAMEGNDALHTRVSGMYMLDCCGDIVRGRKAMDLTQQEVEKLKQASNDAITIMEWAVECTAEETKQLEAYVNGEGPLPKRAKEAIEASHKLEEQMKQRQQERKKMEEKTQKAAQKTDQKPKREKVGLDDLMNEEKSKKTFKKAAAPQTGKKQQKENHM